MFSKLLLKTNSVVNNTIQKNAFGDCLYHAIDELSGKEEIHGINKLYSGLNNVQLNHKQLLVSHFPTYI